MKRKDIELDVQSDSSIPKYQQVIKGILDNIEQGNLEINDTLPSISQLSIKYLLSKDTVERAYKELKDQGIISSVMGKGFYVKNDRPKSKLKVLILFNKMSAYKKTIYNQIAHGLVDKANLTFHVFHCRLDLFESTLEEYQHGFNYYVVMPHFIERDLQKILNSLSKVPSGKLILVDNNVEGLDAKGVIYQDFKMDIYHALLSGLDQLRKYQKLNLVFPENEFYPYPKSIIDGFRRFCSFQDFQYDVLSEINESTQIERNAVYIIIEELDLARIIKLSREQGMTLKKDFGILSYNDTPLKEVLENGISVLTTDFEQMGATVVKMILNEASGVIKNDFRLIARNSF